MEGVSKTWSGRARAELFRVWAGPGLIGDRASWNEGAEPGNGSGAPGTGGADNAS